MTRATLLPYLTGRSDTWARSDWLARVGDGDFGAVDDVAAVWDFHTQLTLREHTTIDVDALLTTCGLPAEAGLAYVVMAECEAVGRRDVAFGQDLPSSGVVQIESEFTAAAGTLAGALRVGRQVVVTEPGRATPPAATMPGAVVLSESPTEIVLDDGAGRFPTEVVDFATLLYPDAVWRLSVAWDSPEEAFASAVRLSLNSANPVIQRLLADPTTAESERAVEVITWDWQRQLLAGAAVRAETFADRTFPEESLGGVVHRMIRDRLGLAGVRELREHVETSGTFEELLQARTGLFHA